MRARSGIVASGLLLLLVSGCRSYDLRFEPAEPRPDPEVLAVWNTHRDVLVRADAKSDQTGEPAESPEAEEGRQEGDEEASAEGDDVSPEPPGEQESAVEPEADVSAPEGETADEPDDDADDEEEHELNLAEDPNEVPDVDLQLDTALLLMRLHLLGEDGLELASGAEKSLPEKVQRP